jgi:hypothetical protein
MLNGLDDLGFLLQRAKEIAIFEEGAGPVPWKV